MNFWNNLPQSIRRGQMGAGGRTVRHRVQPHHRVQISASAVSAQGVCKPAGGGLRWPGIDITLFGETFKWNILATTRPRRPALLLRLHGGHGHRRVHQFPHPAQPRLPQQGQPRQADRLVSAGFSASSPASSTPSTASGWLWPVCWCLISSTTSAPRYSTAASRWSSSSS